MVTKLDRVFTEVIAWVVTWLARSAAVLSVTGFTRAVAGLAVVIDRLAMSMSLLEWSIARLAGSVPGLARSVAALARVFLKVVAGVIIRLA